MDELLEILLVKLQELKEFEKSKKEKHDEPILKNEQDGRVVGSTIFKINSRMGKITPEEEQELAELHEKMVREAERSRWGGKADKSPKGIVAFIRQCLEENPEMRPGEIWNRIPEDDEIVVKGYKLYRDEGELFQEKIGARDLPRRSLSKYRFYKYVQKVKKELKN